MKSILSCFFISLVIFSGCYVNPDNIKSSNLGKSENTLTWTVEAPIETVFKKYRDYTETNLSGGDFLWSGGRRVKANFYGPDAEISLIHEGNPLIKKIYLNLKLEQKTKTLTTIKYWYAARGYEQYAKAYQKLIQSH